MRSLTALLIAAFLTTPSAAAREWVSVTGEHKVEAEMVSYKDGKVWLKTPSGTVLHVPLDQLSLVDREYAKRRAHDQAAGTPPASQPPAPQSPVPQPGTTQQAVPPGIPQMGGPQPGAVPPGMPQFGGPQMGMPPGFRPPGMSSPGSTSPKTRQPAKYGMPAELFDQVKPAIVRIQLSGRESCGFVVDPSGLVITNCQAVNGVKAVTLVFHDGTSANATGYVGVDMARDMIVLKVDAGRPLASVSLQQTPPKAGDTVFAFGASQRLSQSAYRGRVESVQTSQQCQAAYQETTGRFERPADALWLRVTTPAFTSTWGGPIVDEQGQVLGMSSRTKFQGQSLNFAIASQDIAKLLSACPSNELQSLSNLPGNLSANVGGLHRPPTFPYHGFPTVPVSSESTLSFADVRVPDNWPESSITKESGVRTLEFENGEPKSIHAFLNARLHGPSFLLNEDGTKRWAGDYLEGDRHGSLRLWNQDADMAMFAQYVRGRKMGLVCVFEDGIPRLLQQWDKNKKTGEKLIKWNAGVPVACDCDQLSEPTDIAALAAATDQLAELEDSLKEEEGTVKRELAKWFREMDRQIKQQRAAALNVRKRGEIIGSINAREKAVQAAVTQQWQRAMTGK